MNLLLLVLSAFAATVEIFPGDDVATLTGAPGPGDEFVFHGGTYSLDNTLTWTALGTADAPVIFRAATGEAPIFEYAAGGWAFLYVNESTFVEVRGIVFQGAEGWDSGSSAGVYISNSSDITFSDNEVTQSASTLLYLANNDARLTIENNHLHSSTSHGIYSGCDDASCWTSDSVINHNWVHDLTGQYSYGMYLANGAQGNTLTDNVIYDIGYRGVTVASTEGGEPNVVEGNVIWNAVEVGLNIRGASRVRNNVVFNIDGLGIKSADNGRETLDDVVISFNTVVNTTGYAASIADWAGRTDNVFANNALCNPTGYGVVYDAAAEGETDSSVVSGNIICGLVDGLDPLGTGYTAGGGYDDFTDAEGWDFYPTDGSHLVDDADPSGTTWVPETDFNGAARQGDAPDVGAYEWTGGDNPGWAIAEGFKSLELEDSVGEPEGGCCGGKGKTEEAILLLPLAGLGLLRRRT